MTYRLSIILLATLPLQFALPLSSQWEIPLARFLAALIIVVFLVEALYRREWLLPRPVVVGLWVSFLAVAVGSLFWALQPEAALPKIAFLLNFGPLVFVWSDLFRREVRAQVALMRALVIGAAAAAVLALLFFLSQFVWGVGEIFHVLVDRILPFFLGRELGALVASYPSLLVNIDGTTILRATAFFPDPHVAAYFFGMSGFLALGLAHYFQRPGYGWIAGLLFLADLLTFSRGGYLGLLAAVLAYAVFSHPVFSIEGRRRLRLVLGGVLLALLITGGPILSRFFTSFSVTDASSAERVVLWQEALRTITHAPVLGTGLGNYLTSARPFAVPGTPFYAHNLYLDVAVELGLVGLIFFLGIFLAALWFLAREKRRWVFTPAVFAALILYLMHSFFETALFSLHVTLLLILCLALAETVGTEDDQREIRAA